MVDNIDEDGLAPILNMESHILIDPATAINFKGITLEELNDARLFIAEAEAFWKHWRYCSLEGTLVCYATTASANASTIAALNSSDAPSRKTSTVR